MIQSILSGDYSKFEYLVDRYQGMVYSQALKITKSKEEAEDITQEVFLKAFESLSTFRGESQFSSWLFKIGQNLALSKVRKNKKQITKPSEDLENLQIKESNHSDSNHNPESLVIKKETSSKVMDLLSKLPITYKKPLVLYYFENMSYGEIAETMGLKLNTLKSHILRGKEIMKRWMQNESEKE